MIIREYVHVCGHVEPELTLAVAPVRVFVLHAHRGAPTALVGRALSHAPGVDASAGSVDQARAVAREAMRVGRAR